MKDLQISLILREVKQTLQQIYQDKLSDVILFGSYAIQKANQNSDIDILIVLNYEYDLDQEIARTSHAIAFLCLEHDTLINRLFMSKSYYQTHKSALVRNIQRDGVRL
jgi:predicted nucleotidyltransferase